MGYQITSPLLAGVICRVPQSPRDGGGCVTLLCWKQMEGGLMLCLLLCSPLLCRKDP